MKKQIEITTKKRINFIRNAFAFYLYRIFYAMLLISLFINQKVNSQAWKQLGPGVGGQERVLYLYKNTAGNYDIYVGSDISATSGTSFCRGLYFVRLQTEREVLTKKFIKN